MLKQLKKKVDFLDDLPLVFWQYLSPDFTKNIKLDLIKIYTERAVGKCPRWNFYTPRKPKNLKKKSGNSFGGHPVCTILELASKTNVSVMSWLPLVIVQIVQDDN